MPADDDATEPEDRNPVDQLVDLCVYAPIGFALEARTLLPGLVDRGRAQVGVARMVGEFAVKWGSTKVEAAVVDAQEQAMGLLRKTGLAPAEERDRSADAPERPRADTPAAAPTSPVAVVRDTGEGEEPAPALPAEERAAAGDAADLAIPDYDNLSASQVVPRLEGLTPEELDAVDRYERAHRGRNTILNKVAQLRSPEG